MNSKMKAFAYEILIVILGGAASGVSGYLAVGHYAFLWSAVGGGALLVRAVDHLAKVLNVAPPALTPVTTSQVVATPPSPVVAPPVVKP